MNTEFDKIGCELPSGLLVTEKVFQDYFDDLAQEAGQATKEIGGKWLKFGRLAVPLLAAVGSMIGLSLDNSGSNQDTVYAAPDLQPVPTPETGLNCRIGSPEQIYSLCLRFTDKLNRNRFLGVNNTSIDSTGTPIGGVDDWINNNNYIQTYLLNRAHHLPVPFIASLALHPSRDILYLGVISNPGTNIYTIGGGELVNISQPADVTRNIRVTSEGINFEVDGNFDASRYIREDINDFIERNITTALDALNNGRYRISADVTGTRTGTRWFRIVDATPTPTILIPTRTPTVQPSPTRGLTVEPTPGIKASNFGIESPFGLTWTDGNMEDSYLVIMFGRNGIVLAPNGLLPRDSVSYAVSDLSSEMACFMIIARRNEAVINTSDLFCSQQLHSQVFSPRFRVGLSGNLTNISIDGRGIPADNYVLAAFNGSGQRQTPFSGEGRIMTTLDDTRGLPTVYITFALQGGRPVGWTDLLLVFPGVAR